MNELMLEIQKDIAAWYQVISVLFGLLAALGVGVGIAYKIYVVLRNNRRDRQCYRRALNKQLTELAHEAALFNQRQDFQSEFMSYQEKRYNRSQAIIQKFAYDVAEIKADKKAG